MVDIDQDFEPAHDDSEDDEETIEKDEEEHGDVRYLNSYVLEEGHGDVRYLNSMF